MHDDSALALSCSCSRSMSLPLPGPAGTDRLSNRLHNRQQGQDRRSALDAIAGLNLDRGIAIEENIHARAKLDEPHALAAGHVVSHFKVENDAARDQAGNLLKYYGTAFAFDSNDVLFILLRRMRAHGVEELAALIAHVADHAGDRRAVHVHIEDAEEDADPVPGSAIGSHQRDIGHFAIAWRNYSPG